MSSSDLAISVRGVGKKYVIRHDRTAPTTLGEAVAQTHPSSVRAAEREAVLGAEGRHLRRPAGRGAGDRSAATAPARARC